MDTDDGNGKGEAPPQAPNPKPAGSRDNAADLRAAGRLLVDATKGVTGVVESMHRTIGSGPALLGSPLAGPARVLTGLVYGGVRAVTDVVGTSIESLLAELTPLLGESVPGSEREAILAAVNGVVGDLLARTNNPLAIEPRFRREGKPLILEREALSEAIADPSSRVLVMVHGSSMNDLQWRSAGHDHGALLSQAFGFTSLALHYNSGLHVSQNGEAFAALLEQLCGAWPTHLAEVVIVTHSMGGLVARSACHAGERAGHAWRAKLTKLATLGTPHHGAVLERGGNWVDTLLGVSRYSAPLAVLGKIRSAGVTDLRYGNVLEEDWRGRDRFALGGDPRAPLPLPGGVDCLAIAGTTAAEGAGGPLPGDGLVSVDSALGRHKDPARTLSFATAVVHSTNHLQLLASPEVTVTLRRFLA